MKTGGNPTDYHGEDSTTDPPGSLLWLCTQLHNYVRMDTEVLNRVNHCASQSPAVAQHDTLVLNIKSEIYILEQNQINWHLVPGLTN